MIRCLRMLKYARPQLVQLVSLLAVISGSVLLDVLKPWPVRSSQSLPGGWGVTVDDVLAAFYVNVVVLAAYGGRLMLAG